MNRNTIIAVCMLGFLLVSCKNGADVVEEYRVRVIHRLRNITALKESMPDSRTFLTGLTERHAVTLKTKSIFSIFGTYEAVMEGSPIGVKGPQVIYTTSGGNTDAMYEDDFKKLEGFNAGDSSFASSVPGTIQISQKVFTALDFLNPSHFTTQGGKYYLERPDDVKGFLEGMLRVKYMIIVKTLYHISPRLSGESTFSPGIITARGLLFDVDNRKYLGGFKITATSSSQIEEWMVKNEFDQNMPRDNKDLENDLELDLSGNFQNSLKAAVQRFVVNSATDL